MSQVAKNKKQGTENKEQKYITNSADQTREIGQKLGQKILKTKSKKSALIIGLEGELGGGKTTFLQGFAKGLGIKDKILSPTFVILKKFKLAEDKKFQYFFHIDCYRIQKPKELLDLGFEEIISNPQNIIVIEWVERVKKILSKDILSIKFKFINEKKREITWR